jgi:hypothetical protein
MNDSSIFQPHEWKKVLLFLEKDIFNFDTKKKNSLIKEIKIYLDENGYGKEKRRRKRKRNN